MKNVMPIIEKHIIINAIIITLFVMDSYVIMVKCHWSVALLLGLSANHRPTFVT